MINRIIQQDKVITAVNRHLPSERQLSGLSMASINEWTQRNKDIDLSSISLLLANISGRIGVLHDRSNPPVNGAKVGDLDALVASIEDEMANKAVNRTP